jgi:nucleoside-diphosphate-sugar epimerase
MRVAQVLITGGAGESGRWIVDTFIRDGWDVTMVDQLSPDDEFLSPYEEISYREIDLTNCKEVIEMIHDVNPAVVIHWAAYSSETQSTPGIMFSNNVLTAYSTLLAAGQVGADMVIASSDAVYGYERLPSKFPITIDEKCRPSDVYGLSKLVSEEMAQFIVRKYNVNVRVLRTTWIQYPGEYDCLDVQQAPEYGMTNYWNYCDVRDVVSAVQAAVTAKCEGFHRFNIIAADNYIGHPTKDLLKKYFDRPTITIDLSGDASAYSTERSEEILGWSPSHSWKTAAEENASAPLLER